MRFQLARREPDGSIHVRRNNGLWGAVLAYGTEPWCVRLYSTDSSAARARSRVTKRGVAAFIEVRVERDADTVEQCPLLTRYLLDARVTVEDACRRCQKAGKLSFRADLWYGLLVWLTKYEKPLPQTYATSDFLESFRGVWTDAEITDVAKRNGISMAAAAN